MGSMRARLQKLSGAERSLADYEGLLPADQIVAAREAATALAGSRVLYLSSTPLEAADCGAPLAALLTSLGIEADRAVLHGDPAFQRGAGIAAAGVRGVALEETDVDLGALSEACEGAAVALDARGYDAVVVQGVPAAALIEGRRSEGPAWVWRTGLDASAPNPHVWSWLHPLLESHRALAFALPAYVPDGLGGERLRILPGGFDPLAIPVAAPGAAGRLLAEAGLDMSRPLACTVGPLDVWADPPAAIEAWRLACEQVPGLQLAIAGRTDPADPEAAGVIKEIRSFAGEDGDLHVLTDRTGATPEAISAAGWIARAAIHSSLGEEFDPALAASLWRGTPVIAGGEAAAAQLRDGADGYLADDMKERAGRLAELASDPGLAAAMARAGRARALAHFGIGRVLADELDLLAALLRSPASSRPGASELGVAAA